MLTRLLRTYLSRYKRELVLVVVLQLLATAAMLYLPTLNADIIDYGVARGDTDYILHTGVVMLAVTLAQVFGSVVAIYFGARAAMATGRDIRHDLAHRVNDFSQREMGKFGAPSLITRTTNDVQQVQMLAVMSVSLVIMAPIMCIGGVIMGIRVAPGMWWVLAVAVPILGVFMTVAINRMIPGFRAMQERIDTVNRVLREQITGIRVVRAFVREPEEIERFGVANDLLASAALRVGRIFAMVFPVVMGVTNVTMVAIIWVGGHQIVDGKMEIGALTALMSYVMQILMAVMMVSFLAMMAPRAAVCAERIMEVLETPTSVAPPPYPVGFTSDPAEVEFHDAAFAYPGADEPVLTNLTFTCRPGTTTAIVGSTGSGKSTLVSLIPRLIDTTAGAVTVGGTPVADLDPDLLRSVIGVVPQRPYLFSGTVASNLRYGRAEATDEELWEALRIAQAADFVAEMPDGLESAIAQGGTTVSGGQRQRLAIARALVRRPSVYLFDDAFSALDVATDARLRAALAPATADSTVIIVAQRISTIADADQIIVLDRGHVVGRGRHDELLASCPTYAEIAESQLAITAGGAA
ncbi:MAG TPA: ABC transporter ATP-binding protein [Gordonia sp. (in: high G+C Gram-positive bacteria)]|uniref:ABC transporter ATP-binding protein n=1 Tax=unclassified Gordonia (in: high G+C Gram-positive bacteria) TaxID=2657482 RepID=UPI000FC1F692|nr:MULTISPECIES: ABC transporter ATP-binding protein [unclassified Gordonia (in: high G+C Gram-positive bacteria)]RUP40284.1 MAG: ABC transporter ATP-binding protein [Gordonia sp. (in: high G+C Gram-positive bacteria)]HNP57236.1 ABC transporter ATP-binding protein [Gordonia sp. (in: high G+C Gram-positive bacteria)]HRC49300.1 ABC transporter ATP-binding protein [Gordonia sp. (in: high G+C Gram-positive bacteria)]